MNVAARIGLAGVLLTFGSFALAQQDVAEGQKAFESQCASCHTVKPGVNGFGPSLAGIVGHPAGHVPGYNYSGAMTSSGLIWDEATLDAFLTDTSKKVPGTSMPVAIPDAHVRSVIIAYLRSVATMTAPAAAAAPSEAAAAARPMPSGGPTQAELTNAAASTRDWLYASKDYTGQRFVKLSQINRKNAHDLRPICIIRANSATPTQTNPLVYKGVMYVTVDTSIAAIDATTCRQRWIYKWETKGRVLSPANRGVAIKDGIVVRGTADGYLIALTMDKGQLLWSRQIASAESSQYLSMPPLMFEDMVIYGPAGADWGAKNWIGAFKLQTGEPVWRFNLIPDDNEPGADSWKDPKARAHGGGSLWTPLAFDAERGVLYLPVGNPAPDFFGAAREGDNLYTNSAVALNVRTGKLLWYRQFVSNDVHDSDLSQVSPIFSGTVGGKSRRLMTVSGKDGLLYMLDRDTHEKLYQLEITTRKNIDAQPTVAGVHRCPGLLGGMEWNGPAYDPLSKTLYVATVDWCGTFTRTADAPEFTPFAHYYGGSVTPDPRDQSRGWLTAIDSTSGKVRWKKQWPTPLVAAVTATSGGVLFTGDLDNYFLVIDASNGNTLYKFNTGGSVGGGVVTYEIGGKQYVATTSGVVSGFFGGSGTSAIIVFALH
ncbi:MAG TPA: PQQ-binding-like beta-propeller repeat protein [Casimicrobiaceae bacterium]|nr:PQQ-binding-like beta-propeller repeat protein [Casimicrobiaceae bacterium]